MGQGADGGRSWDKRGGARPNESIAVILLEESTIALNLPLLHPQATPHHLDAAEGGEAARPPCQ